MNKLHCTFLAIIASSLKGESAPHLPELSEEEWGEMSRIAMEQKLLPLFFDAVYQQAPLQNLRNSVRQQVMLQTMKTDEFLRLYEKWNQADVHPIVVKGIICRSLYNKPDHRPSSDEDVLINAEELFSAKNVLEEHGMSAPEGSEESYEMPYRKSGSALFIELHKSLFDSKSQSYGQWNDLFEHVFFNPYKVSIQGVDVYTLQPTDHLLYLICHALKHFVHSGFGIRQVCDIVLFANRFGKDINWNELLQKCSKISASVFAATIFRIGEKYLGFDPVNACYPDYWAGLQVNEEDMLEDLLSAGIYGSSSTGRVHSSNMTLDAVAANNENKKARSSVLGSVFPAADKLVGRFPYLREYPILLPVAWTHRLVQYSKDILSGKTENAVESVRIGNHRIELLRQYGVIK